PEFAFEFLGGGHHLLLQWPKAAVGFWWMAGALAPDALAAGLDHALAIPLLAVALDVAAHGTAGNRAADRGQLLAVAAADLVADQATNHRTGSSAGDAVGILAGTGDLDLLADHAAAVAEAATLVLRAIGLGTGNGGSGHQRQGGQHGQVGKLHGGSSVFGGPQASASTRKPR